MARPTDLFPYRHEMAVGSDWLLGTLRRSADNYLAQLEMRLSVATAMGDGILSRDLTREIVYVTAAIEQLATEAGIHSKD